jgi:hypothetical protein
VSPLAEAAKAEIEALHAHFVKLFTGRTRELARCADAFAADFSMVTPGGEQLDRPLILAFLEQASADPGFRIAIRDVRLIWQSETAALLRYVEEQYRDGKTTRRLSSALFTADTAAPLGVMWRYLHETWLQQSGGETNQLGGDVK